MRKYKYILFDMDNTLLDFTRAEYLSFKRTAIAAGLDYTEEQYREYTAINDMLWKALERGEVTLDYLKTERFRLVLTHFGYPDDESTREKALFMRKTYMGALGEQTCLVDEAAEVCKKLAEKYEMYIVTNGIASVQYSRFDNSEIAPYFRKMFVSEEIGYTKPHTGFFDYVLNYIGDSDKSAYLVIGDSLTSDCDGAIAYGLDICRFNPTGADDKGRTLTYTVRKLTDLYGIL